MVEIDYTVFIQLVLFLLLIWILNQVLYKPLLQIMDRRKGVLDKAQEEVKTVQETIDRRVAAYEEKIRSAKMEAMGQKGDLAKEGSDAAKVITDKAKGEIAGLMGDFQAKLQKELASARDLLRNQSRVISLEIAEKVLGRSIQ
jgi:F-type H+-transporting ATPase subunit b